MVAFCNLAQNQIQIALFFFEEKHAFFFHYANRSHACLTCIKHTQLHVSTQVKTLINLGAHPFHLSLPVDMGKLRLVSIIGKVLSVIASRSSQALLLLLKSSNYWPILMRIAKCVSNFEVSDMVWTHRIGSDIADILPL